MMVDNSDMAKEKPSIASFKWRGENCWLGEKYGKVARIYNKNETYGFEIVK
jgi:hypothetical protein